MAFEGKVVKGESERSEWQQGALPTNVWMPLIFYQGLTLRSKGRRLATKIHWYLVEGKTWICWVYGSDVEVGLRHGRCWSCIKH